MKTVRANILSFPATLIPKSKEYEDVIYKPVSDIVRKVTTIVYNHFNIEAILAARILKQCFPEFNVISVAQLINVKSDLYVWIGIEPKELITKELADKKEHRVYSSHVKLEADDTGMRPSLIDQICLDFMVVRTANIFRMAFQASCFYNTDINLEDLSTIYHDVVASTAFLKGIPNEQLFNSQDNYMKAVKRVKAQFKQSYLDISVIDGENVKRAIHTTFSDQDFIIALRLMKLAHANFINCTTCLNGNLVYSNMAGPKLQNRHEKIVLLN